LGGKHFRNIDDTEALFWVELTQFSCKQVFFDGGLQDGVIIYINCGRI
jgi:hypothetical protein